MDPGIRKDAKIDRREGRREGTEAGKQGPFRHSSVRKMEREEDLFSGGTKTEQNDAGKCV